MRGRGAGLLGERQQHAERVGGERPCGLRDEEGDGGAAPERVGVVVVGGGAHPARALVLAGALQRAVGRHAARGDAEDRDDERPFSVAEGEVAAVGSSCVSPDRYGSYQ